jgi:hypothetical protein
MKLEHNNAIACQMPFERANVSKSMFPDVLVDVWQPLGLKQFGMNTCN